MLFKFTVEKVKRNGGDQLFFRVNQISCKRTQNKTKRDNKQIPQIDVL